LLNLNLDNKESDGRVVRRFLSSPIGLGLNIQMFPAFPANGGGDKLCIPISILRNRTGQPSLASLWQGRKPKKRQSKKSKGKSQVASLTEAVTLALRNRIVP
jgi:hypothetical protein